jgi:hypothetical protein
MVSRRSGIPNKSYATVITAIALALFGLFWNRIDGQLTALDGRLRCIEQQVAGISTALQIHTNGPTSSGQAKSGAAMASPLGGQP